jgi:hypothetical protein
MNRKEAPSEERDTGDLRPLWKSVMRKEKNLVKVVKALALHGPCNIWELSRKEDADRSYTDLPWISLKRYMKDLLGIGFVQVVTKRRALRGRGRSKVYGLTLFGLFGALGDKELASQCGQVIDNYSKIFRREKLEEIAQLHELVREIEKEYPSYGDEVFPSLYSFTHKIFLESWIENPVRAALKRMYGSAPNWSLLQNLLQSKPLLIQYSLQIVKDMIDTYERDLTQARSFMKTLQNLAKGKIPETPEAPETKETLSEYVSRLLGEKDSETATYKRTTS